MQAANKSPEITASVEGSSSVDPAPIASVNDDPQPPVFSQPPLAGQPGLIPQLPLLQPPMTYQPLVMQPVQPVLPHQQEQSVKQEPKGPHPVRSTPIAGTPWSVVWSSDNRRFFFNATNRMSVWNIPEDLESNPLVHKILDETVEGKSGYTVYSVQKFSHYTMGTPLCSYFNYVHVIA